MQFKHKYDHENHMECPICGSNEFHEEGRAELQAWVYICFECDFMLIFSNQKYED